MDKGTENSKKSEEQQDPIIRKISREIISMILEGKIKDTKKLDYIKRTMSRDHQVKGMLRNSDILAHATRAEKEKVSILIKKPVRTISGIAIVAVMARPASCPGKCIYCPQGEYSPKSYTGLEPAARRARMFRYDPYDQVKNRLEQLEAIGHSTGKVELIIMGGTFLSCDKDYQREFVKRCFDALNRKKSKTLEEAQETNETAKSRCVGLTIETRPDFCKEPHVDMMLELGATRVELGVQTLSDDIYEKVQRGHTVRDVIDSTRIMKDAALKIVYHMMPGLFLNEEEDIAMFSTLFTDPRFRPDMIKIYPVLVIEGTGLHEIWSKGGYHALDNKAAAHRVAGMMKTVPKYVRIMRCQRDIPKEKIVAGPTAGNLREMAEEILDKENTPCQCIRCREAGHIYYKKGIAPENPTTQIEKYNASDGTEYFITYEDKKKNIILGFLRLRIPSASPHRKEIDENTALIRELKVFGTSLELDRHEDNEKSHTFQHKGIGAMLLSEAEKIAKKEKKSRILIISAIGTREYYRRFGYRITGPYMGKAILQ